MIQGPEASQSRKKLIKRRNNFPENNLASKELKQGIFTSVVHTILSITSFFSLPLIEPFNTFLSGTFSNGECAWFGVIWLPVCKWADIHIRYHVPNVSICKKYNIVFLKISFVWVGACSKTITRFWPKHITLDCHHCALTKDIEI